MSQAMGIGLLGDPSIVFKQKFRWTFSVENICSGGASAGGSSRKIPPNFVKLASRPNLDIEEVQLDYLNAKDWIPGKGTWNTIDVTYYDVALSGAITSTDGSQSNLFTWLRSVYDFGNPDELKMGSSRRDYAATGILILYDGCGNPLEQWTLQNMWPKAIEFGELDMNSNDICEIKVTLRYSKVVYENKCGIDPAPPCCSGCTGGSLAGPAQ